jgi:serine phosphatase RsbU (regulator of sigma subunit)
MALDPGDVLLLYTDGVTESRTPSGEFFGDHRLAELGGDLVRAAERPAEVLRRIVRSLLEFQGPELRDDATVVYVGWRPPPRRQRRWPPEFGASASRGSRSQGDP